MEPFFDVIQECFDEIVDPRTGLQKRHLLTDILTIGLLAIRLVQVPIYSAEAGLFFAKF
jgi:hypothetical protein